PPAPSGGLAGFGDVAGLRALGAVNDFELDCLSFFERPETIALDGREVNEDVAPAVALNETVTLGVVEPLDLACDTHRTVPACCNGWSRVRAMATLTPGHKKRPRERGLGLRRWPASADEIVKGPGPLSQANPTICAQF